MRLPPSEPCGPSDLISRVSKGHHTVVGGKKNGMTDWDLNSRIRFEVTIPEHHAEGMTYRAQPLHCSDGVPALTDKNGLVRNYTHTLWNTMCLEISLDCYWSFCKGVCALPCFWWEGMNPKSKSENHNPRDGVKHW